MESMPQLIPEDLYNTEYVQVLHYFKRCYNYKTRWKPYFQYRKKIIVILSLVFIICFHILVPLNAEEIKSFDVWQNEVSFQRGRKFVVQWTSSPSEGKVIFRITAKTRGYIGFGFNTKPKMDGADLVVGWVHSGKIYLQDRYGIGNDAPYVDPHQDWDLIGGFENDTHTVLTMARPYDTCDSNDYAITNDTVKVLWAYHSDDPVDPESPKPRLHYHGPIKRGFKSLFLLQRAPKYMAKMPLRINHDKTHYSKEYYSQGADVPLLSWLLIGPEATIDESKDSSVHWCRLFQRPRMNTKHHIVKYEPVFMSPETIKINHMMLYECIRLNRQEEEQLASLSQTEGSFCREPDMQWLMTACNHVVVAWAAGSEGVWFPPEAGYPLEPEGPLFYLLETHYNATAGVPFRDSSGVRLMYTPMLRNYDAGVLSVGVHPNWKHIIPPNQKSFVSEGHCVSECTNYAFPSTGVRVFGTIFHTHLLGSEVRLRHFRKGAELEPIATDKNYDFNYQEYRQLQNPVPVLPNDHLITECTYNSEGRSSITLGGFKTREEICISFVFYYPKVDLSFCHSKPSLETVLLSLGIQKLLHNSSITILLPPELAGKTLKWRLQNYDWDNHFNHFQSTTHMGTFNITCRGHALMAFPKSENRFPSLSKKWRAPNICDSSSAPDKWIPFEESGISSGDELEKMSHDSSDLDKFIERLDVDPANNFDLLMPVIGDEEVETPVHSPPVQGPSNTFLSEEEEMDLIDKELEHELEYEDKNLEQQKVGAGAGRLTSPISGSQISIIYCALIYSLIFVRFM